VYHDGMTRPNKPAQISIQLNLAPETERVLKARAAETGLTLEAFLEEVANREAGLLNHAQGNAPTDLAEYEAGLDELAEGLPPLPTLPALRLRGDSPVTSAQNIAEFWNVCTRPASARGGYGLSIAETERRVRILERLFPVLVEIPTAYPLWRNVVVANAVQGVQVHDARLVALMQAHGISHIVTLNPADFTRYPGVIALHPTAVP
jgi:predicted nucleic acid-binding protein